MNETMVEIEYLFPNPYQPRHSEDPDVVKEIATNILSQANDDFDGLMQPPTVRKNGKGYELAFGHTRRAAFEFLASQGHERYKFMRVFVRDLTDLQMFELGVAENIKRRDLNPIEEAHAMRRYMDDFGKTSKEAGEFFGVAEETVRQKVRLLKLPGAVQDQMRAGDINENTARSLLSMQKVADQAVVIKTAEKIAAKKDIALPDDIIEHTVGNLNNVVELRNNTWPLEMKKFPNQLLPAMTEQAAGAYEKQLEHLTNPPACSACPFYSKMRGSNYCGLRVCYERKQIAWGRHLLEKASKDLGIKIYNKEEDGGYVLLKGYETTHKNMFTKRNAGVRLLSTRDVNGDRYQWGFDGVNNDYVVVVATGPAIAKLGNGTGGTRGGKKTEKEKAEMRMMKVYRVRRKELLWAFTDVAKAMFANVPTAAVMKLSHWKFVGIDDKIPDEYKKGKLATPEAKADMERRELVWAMLEGVSSHYHRQTMADLLNKLQKQAAEWNLKIPASLKKLAEQFDAETTAAAAPKGK
jgi:ParB/RepB/Spo0J family partition protein